MLIACLAAIVLPHVSVYWNWGGGCAGSSHQPFSDIPDRLAPMPEDLCVFCGKPVGGPGIFDAGTGELFCDGDCWQEAQDAARVED